MSNTTLSRNFAFLAAFCFAALLFFFLPYFLLERNNMSTGGIISLVVVAVIGILATATSFSYARRARDDSQ
jgi:drug/metabolite transporter (DMT)-like permease